MRAVAFGNCGVVVVVSKVNCDGVVNLKLYAPVAMGQRDGLPGDAVHHGRFNGYNGVTVVSVSPISVRLVCCLRVQEFRLFPICCDEDGEVFKGRPIRCVLLAQLLLGQRGSLLCQWDVRFCLGGWEVLL